MQHRDQLDQLLTKEVILKYYQADFSKAEIDFGTSSSSPKYWSYTYSWDGDKDRKRRMEAAGFSFAKPYQISISNIKEYDEDVKDPIAHFNNKYRNRTADEKKKAQEAIEKQLEKSDADEKTK